MVFPPLGLWWLWSILEQAGHEVSFIDMSEHNLEAQDIPHGFDAYLVSGTSPQGREIRKLGLEFQRRGMPAMLGGPHATNYPRDSRKYYPLVIRREGERAVDFSDVLGSVFIHHLAHGFHHHHGIVVHQIFERGSRGHGGSFYTTDPGTSSTEEEGRA